MEHDEQIDLSPEEWEKLRYWLARGGSHRLASEDADLDRVLFRLNEMLAVAYMSLDAALADLEGENVLLRRSLLLLRRALDLLHP